MVPGPPFFFSLAFPWGLETQGDECWILGLSSWCNWFLGLWTLPFIWLVWWILVQQEEYSQHTIAWHLPPHHRQDHPNLCFSFSGIGRWTLFWLHKREIKKKRLCEMKEPLRCSATFSPSPLDNSFLPLHLLFGNCSVKFCFVLQFFFLLNVSGC